MAKDAHAEMAAARIALLEAQLAASQAEVAAAKSGAGRAVRFVHQTGRTDKGVWKSVKVDSPTTWGSIPDRLLSVVLDNVEAARAALAEEPVYVVSKSEREAAKAAEFEEAVRKAAEARAAGKP